MITVFCGYDVREAIGFHVFVHSVIKHASQPVSIIPLSSLGLAHGSNAFTSSRFLIPEMMGHKGHAIFADACDMLMMADVAELDALFDPAYAVQVVKHPTYQTKHKTKYRGTDMECPNLDYPRKNWASLMLVNCEHPAWRGIDPTSTSGLNLLRFEGLPDEAIGELPAVWNCLADEGHDCTDAAVLHWTAGVPGFPSYHDAPQAHHWHDARLSMERLG